MILFCLGYVRRSSEEEKQNFLDFMNNLQSTSVEEDESSLLPSWLSYQPKNKNIFEQAKLSETSSYDIVLGEFQYSRVAGKVNKRWFRNEKIVQESSFTVFNSYLRDILKLYADKLNDGFPKEVKIDHSTSLAFCNGILMTFPNIHKKYALILQQVRLGEVTFKESTLKPFAQVLNFCVCVN